MLLFYVLVYPDSILFFRLLSTYVGSNNVRCMQIVHFIDKHNFWHRLPVFFGLLYLGARRSLHQQYNLINVGRTPTGVRSNPADYPYRTADGKFNDPFNEGTGSQFSFFGRNMMPLHQNNKVLQFDFSLSI